MAKAYQYDLTGYYVGETEDYGVLPNNATYVAPAIQEGCIPCWNGKSWEQIEDHKGKQGYLDGQPYTVKEYGPLPDGWSGTPPLPTLDAAKTQKLNELESEYSKALELVTSSYSEAERASWPFKLSEAYELLADPEAEASLLRAELEASRAGQTIAQLAQKVIEKNTAYKRVSGSISGQKKRFMAELETLAAGEGVTAQEILDYKFEYCLPESQAPVAENLEYASVEALSAVKKPAKGLIKRLFRTA